MNVSVAITTYNEGPYLDRLLRDLSIQQFELNFEIILVEAGDYDVDRARICLGDLSDKLIFIHEPMLSRTKSLNLIFERAKGDVVIRLDARSHIYPGYLNDIYTLSMETGAENVGGVISPIGLNERQAMIAEIMRHPMSFGGGKARKARYRGYADSVYLGAFRKGKCKYGEEWFDSTHPKISEDSDLNYRIRKNNGKVFIDSSIVVQHYPRETLVKFFKLCFNYGVGRGLFFIKHRIFSAVRQLVPPLSLVGGVFLVMLSFIYPSAVHLLAVTSFLYLLCVLIVAVSVSRNFRQIPLVCIGFVGCHLFWTVGLIVSPLVYRRDVATDA